MAYMAHDSPDTAVAGFAHSRAITAHLVPLSFGCGSRRDDAFSTREAAKAAAVGVVLVLAVVLATMVRLYVPLLEFLGTLAQLAVLVVAVFSSVQAYRNVNRGSPASYPINIKVVKTND